MTALMINGLSLLMLLFFGAMALFPLFLPDSTGKQLEDHHANEDRVLHISPAPMIERATATARTPQPVVLDGMVPGDTPPSRREAA